MPHHVLPSCRLKWVRDQIATGTGNSEVSFGSLADMAPSYFDVCLTPESGLIGNPSTSANCQFHTFTLPLSGHKFQPSAELHPRERFCTPPYWQRCYAIFPVRTYMRRRPAISDARKF